MSGIAARVCGSWTAQEAVEILEARAVLEGLASRHAALRATPEDVEGLRAILDEMRRRLDAGTCSARRRRTRCSIAGCSRSPATGPPPG